MKFSVLYLFLLGCACSANAYKDSNKIYKKQVQQFSKIIAQVPLKDSMIPQNRSWVGTTNFSMRKPDFVVLHHTGQNSCTQTLQTFTMQRSGVSAHYVICKDGTVYHMLNDYLRAWHSGVSRWGPLTDINSSSVGIELDNNGFEKFTDAQLKSLFRLLDTLKRRYNIPSANFIGHSDAAPGRKVDPNHFFPWRDLADRGYGLWYEDTARIIVPPDFNHLHALRIIGYDVKDTSAAFGAFNRHFLSINSNRFSEASRKIIFQLYRKYE